MPRWSARSRWLMPRSRRPCWSIRPSASGVGISPRTRAMAPPGVGAGGDDFDSDVMIGEVDIDVKGGDFENGVSALRLAGGRWPAALLARRPARRAAPPDASGRAATR